MTRRIQIDGTTFFAIDIPDDSKITFGPWSPPSAEGKFHRQEGTERAGTLRVYKGAKATGDVIAVFSGVKRYYDESLIIVHGPVFDETPAQKKHMAEAEPVETISWREMTDAERDELAEKVADIVTSRAVDP